MSEEQLDPHLKLQREIEGIMQERIKELKETLPESMICSINEGNIPLEFLDRISALIPREVIDKAVNEVERRSAGVTLAKIDKTSDSQLQQETDGCQFSNLEMIEMSAGNTEDQQVPEQVPVQMPEQVSAHLSKPDRDNIQAQVCKRTKTSFTFIHSSVHQSFILYCQYKIEFVSCSFDIRMCEISSSSDHHHGLYLSCFSFLLSSTRPLLKVLSYISFSCGNFFRCY